MTGPRRCAFRFPDGRSCGAPPLREGRYCRMHDPAHETEVQEGRRLGGMRRRREALLAGTFDFTGLGSIAEVRRVLEIAIFEALGLDNPVARVRFLISGSHEAAILLKTGELEQRIEQLEAAMKSHKDEHSAFDEHDQLGDRFQLPGEPS